MMFQSILSLQIMYFGRSVVSHHLESVSYHSMLQLHLLTLLPSHYSVMQLHLLTLLLEILFFEFWLQVCLILLDFVIY